MRADWAWEAGPGNRAHAHLSGGGGEASVIWSFRAKRKRRGGNFLRAAAAVLTSTSTEASFPFLGEADQFTERVLSELCPPRCLRSFQSGGHLETSVGGVAPFIAQRCSARFYFR